MKSFFAGQHPAPERGGGAAVAILGDPTGPEPAREQHWSARIAIYEAPAAAPRTEEVSSESEAQLIERIAAAVHAHARDAGGDVPYTVIREVAENFIHAHFREPVVSILDGGRTIRFADQGPGISDKDRAVLPGFTTATRPMKTTIRGVGSGLPIVNDYLRFAGGTLEIEDNLGDGTVVTVRVSGQDDSFAPPPPAGVGEPDPEPLPSIGGFPPLTTRQKQVLSLVLELREVGPTIVSKELSVALSTAYRDLAYLEENGLIESDNAGKRVLTSEGSAYLDSLFAQ